MNGLNCVKSQVPSSLSLQSVGVRPTEEEPGFAAITVRAGGHAVPVPIRAEVRVVHGGEEVHAAVRDAVLSCFGADGGAEEEGIGYWAFRVDNTLQVEKERNKFLLALFTHLTGHSWDIVASTNLTPCVDADQIIELFTWMVKKNLNTPPSPDCCMLAVGEKQVEVVTNSGANLSPVNNTVKNVIESLDEQSTIKTKTSESGYISEEDKKDSKASSTEKLDATPEEKPVATPDKVLPDRSLASPDMLSEIDHEVRKSMENLLQMEDDKDQMDTNKENYKGPIEKHESDIETKEEDCSKVMKSPIKLTEGSPKKSIDVQKSKSLLANLFGIRPLSPHVGKLTQDDPNCPAILPLGPPIDNCRLLVDLLHQLFCRQWKSVTSVKTEEGTTLIFLRNDPRILPGLGQQSLAGFSVNSDGLIHLHNASQEIVENIKLFADTKTLGERSSEFCLKEDIPLSKGRELLTEVITIFNNYSFALYSSLELQLSGRHISLLMFRPSTVQATAFLGLSLGHGNLLTLDGGDQEDVDAVRETLNDRWPYPMVSETAVSASSWCWKVKRYPWRMSYGIKLVDRAVDRATKMMRQISFPPPNNSDLESAKSLVVFLVKELAERGWKFGGAHNLHTTNCLLHFSR